ncbi:MAG: hypothetical protein H0W34_10315, partial [Pyrinomonadaceae bacterium]|nr:hypothetical protein [Pyrinomonadaceae bacterium]
RKRIAASCAWSLASSGAAAGIAGGPTAAARESVVRDDHAPPQALADRATHPSVRIRARRTFLVFIAVIIINDTLMGDDSNVLS